MGDWTGQKLAGEGRVAAAHNGARRLPRDGVDGGTDRGECRDLVHRSRAYRSAAAAGWPGRAVRARPDPRLPGAGAFSVRREGAKAVMRKSLIQINNSNYYAPE